MITKRFVSALFIILGPVVFCRAQETPANDSSKTLGEVVVTAFEQNRSESSATATVKIITINNGDRYNKSSLVNAFNTISGVRMEERSPGSYRINIRGSSLRSPFGVRNVKVYWNDLPVTDAGGNTYFNQFAFNNFNNLEIVKGPAGSMYGAGTGGLILIHSLGTGWRPSLNLDYVTGSYGLQNILASATFGEKDRRNLVTYAHTQNDGYRSHTFSRKDNASFVSQIKVSDKQQITASILYTDLLYETPGGLTKAEFLANPKQARPAAGGQPSADQAKATIYQKTFLAGVNQQYDFGSGFKNSTSLYGSFANIRNPTFRNYERRNEPGFGGRTSFNFQRTIDEAKLQLVAGGEWQEGFFNTQVSNNRQGNPDTIQTNDDIRYTTYSLFAQADVAIKESWFITAGVSSNSAKVNFTRLNKYPVIGQGRTYKNEWLPRLSLKKKFGNNNAVFATVSKGYSPPTIAELLPSTGVISTFLEAEQGTNYELGARVLLLHNKLQLDAAGYYFKLNNALVTRKDTANADYYVNAGNAKQKGIEVSASYTASFYSMLVDYIAFTSAYTLSDFKYGDFRKGTTDFSGKRLPSVPQHTISVLTDIQFKKGPYFNATYYYATKIFLDDANTVAADPYHLLGSRIGYKTTVKKRLQLNIYTGADNLLDETYSLGNDINAAAGRYYNAAPGRNYYVGISLGYSKKTERP